MRTFLRGIGGVLLSFAVCGARQASAYDYYVPMIPNAAKLQTLIGSTDGCNICHTAGGGTPLNAFGQNFRQANIDYFGSEDPNTFVWTGDFGPIYGLFDNDADGDGFTNGEELQDPLGEYLPGSPAPGLADLVRVPGDPSSVPPSIVARFSGNTDTRNITAEASTFPADLPFTVEPTGDPTPVQVSIDTPWLSVASATPTGATLHFDISGLPPAAPPYVATVAVHQPNVYRDGLLTVNLTVIVPRSGNLCGTISQQCTSGECCRPDCRFWTSSHSCRAPDQCAAEAFCTGSNTVCPLSRPAPATYVCRTAGDSCQLDVTCDGTSYLCPEEERFKAEGDFCSQTQICDAEHACVPPPNQPLSNPEKKCLNKWHSSAGKAGQQLSKQANRCLSFGVKGELPGILDQCILPDSKTSKSMANGERAARQTCVKSGTPDFGGAASSADLSSVTSEAISGAYHDVYGLDIDAAVPADTKPMDQCQGAVSKSLSKCVGGRFDSFATCVKKGLKSKTDQIQNFVGIQQCLNFESKSTKVSCAMTTQGKTKGSLNKKCDDDAPALAAAFPGCAGSGKALGREALYACLEQTSRCNTCKSLKVWGDLGIDCDDFDDHNPANNSCQ